MIEKLAIIGTGLIGGSLARALRSAEVVDEIVGYGRNLNNMQLAVDMGVVDRAEVTLAKTVEGADMVVLATPVAAMQETIAGLGPLITEDMVITDVGSVKATVIEAAYEAFDDLFGRFVPGHPIAGKECSGVRHAEADLFEGSRVILCPESDTDDDAVEKVRAMWDITGADVVFMSARRHDAILAASSHLPHVLSYALVDNLVRRDEHREIFRYSAGGFRDFTRIAGSDPEMWRDICLANRKEILACLESYRDDLGLLMDAIEAGDGEQLLETFERARHAREIFIKNDADDFDEEDLDEDNLDEDYDDEEDDWDEDRN
jgi:prephenate dehydrogenase